MKKLLREIAFFFLTVAPLLLAAQEDSRGDTYRPAPPLTKEADYNARVEADLTAGLMQKKYGCDSATRNTFFVLFYNKRVEADRVFAEYSGAEDIEKRLLSVLTRYDDEIDRYVYAASIRSYGKRQIARLDSIQLLAPAERKAIEAVFLNLCAKYREKSFAENFNEAMYRAHVDSLYYSALYHAEITRQAAGNAKQAIGELTRKNGLTKEGIRVLSPLLYEKERSLLVVNYAYPYYTREKDSLMQQVTRQYDSLIRIALFHDGSFRTRSKFTMAIQNRQVLKLTATQVDSLVNDALRLDQLRSDFSDSHKEGRFNPKIFESTSLPAILTDEQYTQLLHIVNHEQALEWAKGDWAEIQTRGLVTGLDSAVVVGQIYNYDLEKLMDKDRYVTDAVRLNAALRSAEMSLPSALRKLKAARNANPDRTKGSLQW